MVTLLYYYREATAPKGVKGWLEENEERQANQAEEVDIINKDTETQSAVPVKEDFKESFSLKKLFNRDE